MDKVLHVLTGCTAVGKTEAALRWAEARGAEIVSADSMLFYRGMDIGTAKPTAAQRAGVPHHLIDICDVGKPMDVSRYAALARKAVEEIRSRDRPVLVVGGSGFYLRTFFGPVADELAVPPGVRESVRNMSLADAVGELRRLNPGGLGALDVANPRRVARALERCLASGRTLADLAREFAALPAPFAGWNVALVQLDRPADELDRRIDERTAAMVRGGLVDEVRRLLAAGLAGNPSAAMAIGYREVIALLDGRLAPIQVPAEIAKATRALVKKQRTWFRTQLPPHRVVMAGETSAEALFAD